ncbi:CLUMA_CG000443, isoform A [Clunio marinus]|uniref:CLUMA_CG000443, isoform A n=1 Tax=Clunio marinus TaxID=568069 RepID=A0A1J1HF23_9DIPT|nr:CLUMA_CG000443, isoform A [Clunio marinus]
MAEHDRRSVHERRRNIIYLIAEYLKETGLLKSYSALIDETQLSNDFFVCDNVDLETMYLEFCSYFQVKFGKKPRFIKKVDQNVPKPTHPVSVESRSSLAKKRSSLKTASQMSTIFPENCVKDIETSECLRVFSLSLSTHDDVNNVKLSPIFSKAMSSNHDFFNTHPSDWREMTEIIFKDVITKDLCVKWDDIKGQDDAKMIIQESVIFPVKYPELFNRVHPWKAVLLHGVPGCGKTMLARALCSETHENLTFFNVAASTLISKWRGESEKLIRVLFEFAKFHAPSIIFIDELDSLTSKRCSREHEASKRLKNEFLSMLDGLERVEEGKVFVLGSTNMPWEIDQAFLRRFERKILIDVPSFSERLILIKHFLPSAQHWRDKDLNEVATLSENFTADDLRVAVKEANMMIIRKKIKSSSCESFSDFEVEFQHLRDALKHIKPTPEEDIAKHRQWNSSCGKY